MTAEVSLATCGRGHRLDREDSWTSVGGIARCAACVEAGVPPGVRPPDLEPEICSRGHQDWYSPTASRGRRCRACARERDQRRRDTKKEQP